MKSINVKFLEYVKVIQALYSVIRWFFKNMNGLEEKKQGNGTILRLFNQMDMLSYILWLAYIADILSPNGRCTCMIYCICRPLRCTPLSGGMSSAQKV